MKRYKYTGSNKHTNYVDVLDDDSVIFHQVDGKSVVCPEKFASLYKGDVLVNPKYTEVEFDYEKL